MKEEEVNLKIGKLLFKRRFYILGTTLIFVALAFVMYFFVPKKYSAYSIFMPSGTSTVDEAIKNPSFGFEVHADRAIQILESQIMKDLLIKKFDLLNRFKIDTSSSEWVYNFNRKFSQNIRFSRTPHLSVKINVIMDSPEVAAEIANELLFYYDSISSDMYLAPLFEIKDVLESQRNEKKGKLDSLLLAISNYSTKNGISISDTRLKQLEYKEKIGLQEAGDELIYERLTKGSDVNLEQLITDFDFERNQLYGIQGRLTELNQTLEIPIPRMYVVSKAIADGKPISPKLFWNIFFGLLIGLIVSIGSILLIGAWKDLSKKYK